MPDQTVEVALGEGGEEPGGQGSRCSRDAWNRGLSALTCRRARAASCRQFASLLPTIAGDLVVPVAEDVVEQEHRALDRVQPLQHEQEGHRQRVGLLGRPADPPSSSVSSGSGSHCPTYASRRFARRAQLVDAQAGDHRGQVGLRRGDLDAFLERLLIADEGSWTMSSASLTLASIR